MLPLYWISHTRAPASGLPLGRSTVATASTGLAVPGTSARVNHLNHRPGGSNRSQNGEVPALRVLEERDRRPIQRHISFGKPYPLQAQAERPRRTSQFSHRVTVGAMGWEYRLQTIERHGVSFEPEQNEKRVDTAIELDRLLRTRRPRVERWCEQHNQAKPNSERANRPRHCSDDHHAPS
jgi:hypothetical protein